MRQVAVTGGSGQLGTLIIRRLLDQPSIDKVVCIDQRPPRLASQRVIFVQLDVRDEQLAQHLSQCSALVHCAFLVTDNVSPPHFRSVNVDGSKNVFNAAAVAGIDTIVHLSSMMAYGSVRGQPVPITEATPRVHQPDFLYAACKHEVEAFLDTFERAYPNIAISRLRPGVLLGRNMAHVLGWLLRRRVVPSQDGAPYTIVSDEDVAELAVLALEKRGRGAFNAAAEDLLASDEIARQFGMFALWLPGFLVDGYRALDWCLKKIGLHLAYDAAWLTKTRGVALVLSSERAKNELGWTPRYPTAAAVITRYLEIAPRRLDYRIRTLLALLRLQGRRPGPEFSNRTTRVHLCITGEYGGNFSVGLARGRIAIRKQAPAHPASMICVVSEVLLQIFAGEVDPDHAQKRGELLFEGNEDGPLVLKWMIAAAADLRSGRGVRNAATRAVLRPRVP